MQEEMSDIQGKTESRIQTVYPVRQGWAVSKSKNVRRDHRGAGSGDQTTRASHWVTDI